MINERNDEQEREHYFIVRYGKFVVKLFPAKSSWISVNEQNFLNSDVDSKWYDNLCFF